MVGHVGDVQTGTIIQICQESDSASDWVLKLISASL